MKSKLIRLFAVFASVLVLAVALVVPMSADSFNSANSLIETNWNYVTVLTVKDYERFNDGYLDFSFESIMPCYVIFSINGDRYSIRAESFRTIDDSLEFVAYNDVDYVGLPRIVYEFNNRFIYGFVTQGVNVFDHRYSSIQEFKLVIYHDQMIENIVFDSNYVSVDTVEVEPSTNRITSVFTNIMDWITSGLNSVQGVFYANNQLTLLGTLAVIGVAIAVAFLLVGVLQRFLHLRG